MNVIIWSLDALCTGQCFNDIKIDKENECSRYKCVEDIGWFVGISWIYLTWIVGAWKFKKMFGNRRILRDIGTEYMMETRYTEDAVIQTL